MTNLITESQRKTAKVAGLAYLLPFAVVVYVNFGIHNGLIIDGNTVETARNILAHETSFRVGIVGDLFYCVGTVALTAALYVILEPVSRGLALLAALWRLVWDLMWLAMTLHFFDALRMIQGADYLRPVGEDRLQGLAMLYLNTRLDYYYVGLIFGSLASTLCAYLWLKSRYIPRALAIFGLVSSVWCVACTLAFYIFPTFADVVNLWWFDMPMGIFDVTLSFWLLFKGLNQPKVMINEMEQLTASVRN